VAPRVSPSERVRAAINALFHSDKDLASVLKAVGRLTVRHLMQQAIEAEVDAFLGRRRYEPRTEDCPTSSRNGWQPPRAVRRSVEPAGLSADPAEQRLTPGPHGPFEGRLFRPDREYRRPPPAKRPRAASRAGVARWRAKRRRQHKDDLAGRGRDDS
jgi:hypothetical protein